MGASPHPAPAETRDRQQISRPLQLHDRPRAALNCATEGLAATVTPRTAASVLSHWIASPPSGLHSSASIDSEASLSLRMGPEPLGEPVVIGGHCP